MKKRRLGMMVLLILSLAFTLTACGPGERGEALRADTEAMLDALLAGNADACYALVADSVTREEFDAVYAQWREMLADVYIYELQQTSWNVHVQNGVTETSLGFRMYTDADDFVVEVAAISTVEGFTSFYITPYESLVPTGTPFHMKGANAVQWLFLAVALAETVFVILAVIDCARHLIEKKVLWILLILLGAVTASLTIGPTSIHLNWSLGLVTYTAFLRYGTGEMIFRLMFPIGAIVYVAKRRQLIAQSPAVPEDSAFEDDMMGQG